MQHANVDPDFELNFSYINHDASTNANRLVVFYRHGSQGFARVDIKAGSMYLDDQPYG